MADNTQLSAAVGSGDTLRTEDRTTFKTPVSLIDVGGTSAESILGDSGVTLPVGGLAAENAAASGNPVLIGGRYDATPRTLGDGDVGGIAIDDDGAVHITDGGNAITVDGTLTTVSAVTTVSTVTSLSQFAGNAIDLGNGTTGTGTLRVTLASDSTGVLSVDDNDGSLTVDGTVAATQSGTWNVGAVTSITNTVTVQGSETPLDGIAASAASLPVLSQSMVWNGAAFDLMREGGTAGSLLVDGSTVTQPVSGTVTANAGTGTFTVDNGGTFAVQAAQSGTWNVATVTTVTTCSTVTAITGSSVAHDSADSGNPHKIGAKATTSLAGLTLVADADRTDLRAGTDGALIVRNGYSLEDIVSEVDTNTDGASTAFASGLAAPGAGIRLYITRVTIANSSSSFCTVDLRDGAAGSVLWTLPVPAEGGVTQTFDPPLKLTANTALAYDASAATSTLTISGLGFTSKV